MRRLDWSGAFPFRPPAALLDRAAARFGYAAKGAVHVAVGSLAARAAAGCAFAFVNARYRRIG